LHTLIAITPPFIDVYYVFYLLANPLGNYLIDHYFLVMAH